jgi:alcohol dehydrogenase YqhD (iron-dependent ADH family)
MPEKIFPLGTVHTISAAGSENSRSSVLMDDVESGQKRGIFCDICRPVFAVMNPELTFTVDAFQTGAGTADIFAHTLGRYFMKGYSALSDEFAEGLLRTVVKYGPIALREPRNYEARAELMLAGSFSHNDLTGLGRVFPMAGEHALEAMLSGYYDTAHGAGLAVLMPAMLEYFVNHGTGEQIARAARFGGKVFGAGGETGEAAALEGIRRFRAWLKEIGMPQTLKELGVPKEDLEEAVQRCLDRNGGMIRGYMDLDRAAVTEIYRSVLE